MKMYQGVIKNISTNEIVFKSEMYGSFKKAVKDINKRKINENTQYRAVNEAKGMKTYIKREKERIKKKRPLKRRKK